MRSRPLIALVTGLLAALALSGAASAAAKELSVSQLAHKLRIGYVYIDPKLHKKVDSTLLQKATLDASAHDQGWRFAALTALPKGVATPETTAQAVLDKLRSHKKIVFVAIAQQQKNGSWLLGGASRQRNALLVAQAAKQAEASGGTIASELRAFAQTVASGKLPATQKKSSGGGGTNYWVWLLVILVLGGLGVLLVLRLRARSQDQRQRARGGPIGTARQFHTHRLDELSRRHGELVRTVAERPDNPALAEHHETAGAKLVALRRQLPALFSPRELRTCAAELDQVEWHIECSEALVAGTPLPPQPSPERPGLCFFTHEHGLGTVEIDLVKPDATSATVWICPANAVALSRGEPPIVSSVPSGSRMVPWPAAPTWYGAPGWSQDDLQGLEYQGREIWGRDAPEREAPVEVPPEALAGLAPEALMPPGVSTPLPPGVSAPPVDDDLLPPGVTPPPDEPPDERAPPGDEPVSGFEELDGPAPVGLDTMALAEHDHDEVTAEHPVFEGDHTASYDPLSEEGEHDGDAGSR